eukprot:355369-Chlamydomonas_euryale.AAC.6
MVALDRNCTLLRVGCRRVRWDAAGNARSQEGHVRCAPLFADNGSAVEETVHDSLKNMRVSTRPPMRISALPGEYWLCSAVCVGVSSCQPGPSGQQRPPAESGLPSDEGTTTTPQCSRNCAT